MSLAKSSLLAASILTTLLAGSALPVHAGVSIDVQRAAKAKEARDAVACALTPYHIWIYNPNPARVGFCQNNTPPAPAAPNWGNAGDQSWCGFSCASYQLNQNPSPYVAPTPPPRLTPAR